MLRLSKSDLFLLTPSAAPGPDSLAEQNPLRKRQADSSSAPPTPRTKHLAEPTTPSAARPAGQSLRYDLARALPALWSKAQRDFADGRSDREKEKLRDLIVWLLSKKCDDVRQRQTVNFQHEGRRTSGRIDIVAYCPAGSTLAIEMDWAYARKSLEKLQAAQRQGWEVMWVCGSKMDKEVARALRARANADFGPTYRWLYMFHLEHGWL
jgi:hypothetical protein